MEDNEDFRHRAEDTIRKYYDGCNSADTAKMRSCFTPDAVHYFPHGAPQGPFRGADVVADGWRTAVETLGSRWVIERLAVDERDHVAIVEWTHYKTRQGTYLRGDEWFEFDEHGLIREIRAYYAAPPSVPPRSHELGEFPYVARGYSTTPPPTDPTTASQDLSARPTR